VGGWEGGTGDKGTLGTYRLQAAGGIMVMQTMVCQIQVMVQQVHRPSATPQRTYSPSPCHPSPKPCDPSSPKPWEHTNTQPRLTARRKM
jgi:hypothetical protein